MDCNLGSEIGLKMRSAVKAKLLELGTGGSSGFIDDELPDYVMVMVANKRTKDQMNSELALFLGDQTVLFVTWLHEVLQKLQEVTLPTSSSSKRRKSKTADVSKTKEKKSGKKDKKLQRKSGEEVQGSTADTSAMTLDDMPVINSITDVFAVELLAKAKSSFEVDTNLKDEILQKKKKRKSSDEHSQQPAAAESAAEQDFDIPTMSEITSTTNNTNISAKEVNTLPKEALLGGTREKDLAELAEIQRKIYAAKQHLREIGELEYDEENDEDEDFLNLTEPEESEDECRQESPTKSTQENTSRKVNSPIIFNRRTKTPEPPKETEKQAERTEPLKQRQQPHRSSEERGERRSVHERLGSKPQVTERARASKELYVPAHRRRSELELPEKQSERGREREQREQSERGRERERERSRERSRERRGSRERREPSRELIRKHRSPRDEHSLQRRSSSLDALPASVKHRIGSRVFVAPKKSPEPEYDDLPDKPVNSVIKIKPRPHVSPRRQATKNLLLRAVADAQRSTILAKPIASANPSKDTDEPEVISTTLGKRKSSEASAKVKREQERLRDYDKRTKGALKTVSSEFFRRSTRELVVNVLQLDTAKRPRRSDPLLDAKIVEEEYVPALSVNNYSANYETYVPQLVDTEEIDMHINSHEESNENTAVQKTQFVVTLNGDKSLNKYRKRSGSSHQKRSPSAETPQVSSSSSAAHGSSYGQSTEPSSTTSSGNRRRSKRNAQLKSSSASQSPTVSTTPPPLLARNMQRNNVPLVPHKKIIIKNETDEEDGESVTQQQQHAKRAATKRFSHKKIIIKNESEEEDVDSGTQQQQHTKRAGTKRYSHKKIIINNETDEEDDEPSAQQQQPAKRATSKRSTAEANSPGEMGSNGYKKAAANNRQNYAEERSTTPPLPSKKLGSGVEKNPTNNEKITASVAPSGQVKSKHTPIRFTLKNNDDDPADLAISRKSGSNERDTSTDQRKISIRTIEDRKYDNLPSLSALNVDSVVHKVAKPKERCKYHPNCTKQFCEFYHPTAPCKSFPNCKFADKCLYSHPKCKFDMACISIDCNYAHSGTRDLNHVPLTAPPLSSHVIPVQNYKSISSPITSTTATTMCKYYPNCTKIGCTFLHPRPCRYGKNCVNKLECVFYHPEMQSKFKWVASLG